MEGKREGTTHKGHQYLYQALNPCLCIGAEQDFIRERFTDCVAPQSE